MIPATGVASAAAALAVTPLAGTALVAAVASAGLAGAALAAAIRALAGDAPASLVAAVLASLLAIASFAEHGFIAVAPCIALAAIAWTIALLARPTTSPLVAMLPATIAAILEPASIALLAIAGTRLVQRRATGAANPGAATPIAKPSASAPVASPQWSIAIPIAGGLGVMLAVIAGSAQSGAFATLGEHWFGPRARAATSIAHAIGDAIGPLSAVAALAGIFLLAKLRLAELAVLACAAGAALVDLRAGFVGPATLGIASLCAAVAIGRFAAIIRLPNIQAVAGATVAVMLLVPPVWTVIERVR